MASVIWLRRNVYSYTSKPNLEATNKPHKDVETHAMPLSREGSELRNGLMFGCEITVHDKTPHIISMCIQGISIHFFVRVDCAL
ncbi:hypothetical protein TWF730_002729 [Orbilia blumenaviensis]|uniref:Uncharacterized protein n=1 Tax=Orbilia blumenaviensis TaxID=1796055 RepID=A0AAV9U986_9PEZI